MFVTSRGYDVGMADLDRLGKDLAAEHGDLDLIVSTLDETAWRTPTPAEGWDVRDQVASPGLLRRPGDPRRNRPGGICTKLLGRIAADVGAFHGRVDRQGPLHEWGRGAEWWRSSRDSHAEGVRASRSRHQRISWYGPPMKPASFISARIMETWAHAQDVADAFGISREATGNLRHIAHLAVLARSFSFTSNQLEPPIEPVMVETRRVRTEQPGPGTSRAEDSVRGDAFDFCLVATQRRHLPTRISRSRAPSPRMDVDRTDLCRPARLGPEAGPVCEEER